MDLQEVMKQAQEMQERLSKMQEEMEAVEDEGTAGGGMVKVTLNGKGLITGLSIDDSLMVASEKEILCDLVTAAHNDAKNKIEERYNNRMSEIAGEMGLPPGMNMPG